MKVVGVGWAKTGTTTLAACLRLLGYRHQGGRLDLVPDLPTGDLSRILAAVDDHDSFDDWPWLLLFREIDAVHPGSRFILTLRDEADWLGSYRNMLATQGHASDRLTQVRRIIYGLPFPDVTDEQLIQRYRRHVHDVRAHFDGRPGTLLEVNWAHGGGWAQLCDFLGHAIPDERFPHENRGAYVHER